MLKKFVEIFNEIQFSTGCHQKYVNILHKLYKEEEADEFIDNLILILRKIFEQELNANNICIKRALDFFAQVCATISIEETKNNADSDDDSSQFLSNFIPKILEYTDVNYVGARYYSTKFIDIILSCISRDIDLDDFLYDAIQKKILLRLDDNKIPIKLQAISVLSYLQCPTNPSCPAVQALLNSLNDQNKSIRHDIIKTIAINRLTLSKVIERIDDVNDSVRSITYRKFAEMGPCYIKIVDRIFILEHGFNDKSKSVETAFSNLLRAWLHAYDGNYFKLLHSLYLASSEEDLSVMMKIGKSVMKFFLKSEPIEELIETLPIENKLIPDSHFNTEILLYWKCVVDYLHSIDHLEHYIEKVVPELTKFCHYIESIISKKSQEKMDDFAWTDYQIHLLILFEIVENYDFSDEVGRCTLRNLVRNILMKHRLIDKLLTKIIQIYFKTCTNIDVLINDMYEIITEIRTESEVKVLQFQFKENVKIERGDGDGDTTLDFKKLGISEQENYTTCLCLDILIKTLELPAVKKMKPKLNDLKENFLLKLLVNEHIEIHWRTLKCLSLFCCIDKETAEMLCQVFILPIMAYRYSNYVETRALEVCIKTLIDLFRIYGKKLISKDNVYIKSEDSELYSPEIWFPEVLLKILDDKHEKIKVTALKVLCHTISIFPLTSTILTKILLDWFVLSANRRTDPLKDTYGFFIQTYVKLDKNSREVLRKTIKPVVNKIIRAPTVDPMSKINLDELVCFFSGIISSDKKENLEDSIQDLLTKISKTYSTTIQQFFTKILLNIDLPKEDFDSDKQISDRIGTILPNLSDTLTIKNLSKFLTKLTKIQSNEGVDKNCDQLRVDKQQFKRKKSRGEVTKTSETDKSNSSNGDYRIENITSSSENNDRTITCIIDITSDSDNDKRAKIDSLES